MRTQCYLMKGMTMTKDLSDVVSDLKDAEAKINKEPAPKKLQQQELPDVLTLDDGRKFVKAGKTIVELDTIVSPKGRAERAAHVAKVAEEKAKTTKTENEPKSTMTREDKIVELLTHFCQECGHMTYTKAGQTNSGRYPKPEAWKYLADIAGYYTRVENTKYCGWQNNPCAYRVEATCSLVRKKDDVVVTTVTMCAASDEPFVKNKTVEVAYGLAITRAETRAVRSHLGHYMSCVGLEITPYEELGDEFMDLEEL